MSGLKFPYPPQYPDYTPVPNSDPDITTTVQLTPLANVSTDAVFNIILQLLIIMQQMQKLLVMVHV